MVIRKIYQIMRKQYPGEKKEIRQKIIAEYGKLFEGEVNLKLLIKFIRSKME